MHLVSLLRVASGALLAGAISAQGTPRLVADLDPGPAFFHLTASGFTRFGGITLFARSTPREGSELWRTDGTSAGTTLIADVFPGPDSSIPRGLVTLGGSMFFRADTHRGTGLFRTDGTARGTRQFAALSRDDGWAGIAVAGTLMFLVARDASNAPYRLWRSDGTEAGTFMVPAPEPAAGLTTLPVVLGTEVVFGLDDSAHGTELWASDGSSMRLVKDFVPGPTSGFGSELRRSAVVGGALLFAQRDGAHGVELWRTDGTDAGTYLLRDVWPGPTSGLTQNFPIAVHQGTAYFAATDPIHGAELWRSDGAAAGTNLVADLIPGANSDGPGPILAARSGLFFLAPAGAATGLYHSDGSATGTALLRSLTWHYAYTGQVMVEAGGLVYFTLLGFELWRTDGTTLGTYPLHATVSPFMYVTALHDGGGYLVFTAVDQVGRSQTLRSDGTVAGTVPLDDYRVHAGGRPAEITWLGRTVYFSAETPGHGRELWKSDGTAVGTAMVREIAPDIEGADPSWLTVVGDRLFFAARHLRGASTGLWCSDGTHAGTTLVTGQLSGVSVLTELRGNLVFAAYPQTSGPMLYRSDGTAAGTQSVAPVAASSFYVEGSGRLAQMDGILYFQGEQAGAGAELWRSDGTSAGTYMVTEIVPGSGGTWLTSPTPIDGVLYFIAATPEAGEELWRSDGTAAGTYLVKDIRPGPESSMLRPMVAVGNTLYFCAQDGVNGYELWRSDGTNAGTFMVRDLRPGADGAFPQSLTAVGDRLLFTLDMPGVGFEPWSSNGTAAGTFLLRDLLPGLGSGLQVSRGACFFAFPGAGHALLVGSDGVAGREFWTTNGASVAGPHADIAPGPFSANPGSGWPATYGAGRIWFAADDTQSGEELWSMPSMAAAVPFGSECAPPGVAAPVLIGSGGAPTVGNAAFTLEVRRARPASSVLLLLGVDPGFTPIGGTSCSLALAPAGITEVRLGFTDGAGRGRFAVPVPADPAIEGTEAYAQVLVLDPVSAPSPTASRGLEIALRLR